MIHARERRRYPSVVQEVVPAFLRVHALGSLGCGALDLEVHGVLVEPRHVALVVFAVVVFIARFFVEIVGIVEAVDAVRGDDVLPHLIVDGLVVADHLDGLVIRVPSSVFPVALNRVNGWRGVVVVLFFRGGVLGPDALAEVRLFLGRVIVRFVLRVRFGFEIEPGSLERTRRILGRGRGARVLPVRASPHSRKPDPTRGDVPAFFTPLQPPLAPPAAHHPVALTPSRRGRVGPQRSKGRSKARTRVSNGLPCAVLCRPARS